VTFEANRELPARAGDALWRALVDSVPYYVAVVSPEGRLIYLNHTLGSLPPSVFTGRHVSELAPIPPPSVDERLRRVLAADRPEEIEIPITAGDNTRWFQFLLNGIRDRDGAALGVLVVGQDVTEQRQIGIELRMSVNALHRLVEAREQLAADLHDGILQSLYGIGLRVEAARAGLPPGASATAHLETALSQVKDTMAEIRRFIRDERATGSLSVRWEDTLAGVLHGLEVGTGPRLAIEVPAALAARVPERIRNELIFIAREAVSNAIRHSGAGRVMVRLAEDQAGLRLEVEDDGRGFTSGANPEGIGLLSMTRRAGRIGAILTLHPGPAGGTVVRLELPASTETP
jgi:PAS domain S-box-containing protein